MSSQVPIPASASTDEATITTLHATNQKLDAFPIVTLPSGQKIPTGTIGTLLYNIRLYDDLKSKSEPSEDEQAELSKLETKMRATIPILEKVGMFGLFSPEEWSAEGEKSEGRKFVGKCALEAEVEKGEKA